MSRMNSNRRSLPGYSIDPDIAAASTIDSSFYRDEEIYALARERI